MRASEEILRRALITEKAVSEKEAGNRYWFEVSLNASKPKIRQSVEELFNVKVEDVHTMIFRGKIRRLGRHRGRRPNFKKAIVTLAKGQSIPLFERK